MNARARRRADLVRIYLTNSEPTLTAAECLALASAYLPERTPSRVAAQPGALPDSKEPPPGPVPPAGPMRTGRRPNPGGDSV